MPPPFVLVPCSAMLKIGDFASSGATPSPSHVDGRSSTRYIPPEMYRSGKGAVSHLNELPPAMSGHVVSASRSGRFVLCRER